jgi:hypothetical protein
MSQTNETSINNLSKHLFWDVDASQLNLIKSKKIIIQRVLDYGLMNDWQILLKIYGIAEIAETAVTLRDLDKKSATFISLLSNIPIGQFLCFTSKQSIPEHLIF